MILSMLSEEEFRTLETEVVFLPEKLTPSKARECLRLALEEFRWLRPSWFERPARRIDPDRIDYAPLLERFETMGSVTVHARRDEEEFLTLSTSRAGHLKRTGSLLWVTPLEKASQASWRKAHCEQVEALMRLLDSPLGWSARSDDVHVKVNRLVEQEVGQQLEPTVRDCGEGLAGLFWRNFYGEPFVRLFGERLERLPAECVVRLGGGRLLVQPYELPGEAGSEQARARERAFIHLLGSECFYDHERQQKPTRWPDL
jgi:hypothetical protein